MIDDLDAWRAEGRFRFANRLQAWAEIEHGRIVDAGCSGGGLMGATTVRLAKLRATFQPVQLPDLRPDRLRTPRMATPRSRSCRPPVDAPDCPRRGA